MDNPAAATTISPLRSRYARAPVRTMATTPPRSPVPSARANRAWSAPPTPKSSSPMNPNQPSAALNAPNRSAPSQSSRNGAVTNEVTAATADDTSPVAIVRVDRRVRDTIGLPPRAALDWRQSKQSRTGSTSPELRRLKSEGGTTL